MPDSSLAVSRRIAYWLVLAALLAVASWQGYSLTQAEHLRTEHTLRTAAIMDVVPVAIIACDAYGQISICNEAAEDLFGYPVAPTIRDPSLRRSQVLLVERCEAGPILVFSDPRDTEEVFCESVVSLWDGQTYPAPVKKFNVCVRRQDGTFLRTVATARRIRNAHGDEFVLVLQPTDDLLKDCELADGVELLLPSNDCGE